MSHFATLSYPDRGRRVTVCVMSDGGVEVSIIDDDGCVVDENTEQIDARDAQRLITDWFSVATQLPDRRDGPMEFTIGDGDDRRAYHVSEYDLPMRGLEVVRMMRTIASDVLAGYAARSPRRQGGPRTKRMTSLAFIGWSFAFGFGFLTANIIGTLVRLAGAFTGPFSFAVANSLALFLSWASYYKIGQMFGEEYRGNANIWLPAIVGTLPFVYVYVAFGSAGAVFALVYALAMPFCAYQGEQTGH